MASSTQSNKGTFQPDSDVHITYEDQQKINQFARHNARLEDIKEELIKRENELRNHEEAIDELALSSEDTIPNLMGEVFMCYTVEETQQNLEESIENKKEEIRELNAKIDEVKQLMSELKGHLYGRFGSHINLENED